jgi:hypothetical protein
MLTEMQYSFDRHTQFLKESILKNTQYFNLHVISIAITCVSSIQQYKTIFPKQNISPLQNIDR